jgi:hypothetical protein
MSNILEYLVFAVVLATYGMLVFVGPTLLGV